MTETQKKLLELTNEIADICDANDIVYYLAGGSTIGVLRHKGFIPWDDDMDIMMTRKNWEKFLEATRTQMPEGRVLMCQENSRSYNNMFGRYVDATSSTIHRGDVLGGGAAGFVIDILCLDPIPNEQTHKKYIEDLMLYSDLINPLLNYSARWGVNSDRYAKYLAKVEKEGRDAVLSELEARMFCYEEDDCDYLALRWGGVPFLFDKKMYGSSRWGEFEGRQYRIMDRAGDYLTQHYGDEWAYIPPHDEQMTHEAIFSPEIGYEYIQNDYLPLIDVDKEKAFFLAEKKKSIRDPEKTFADQDLAADLIIRTAKYALKRRIENADITLSSLLDRHDYSRIIELFGDYIRQQGSRDVIGREDFAGIRRFINPYLIDIPEDWFSTVIVALVNSNKMTKAMRFMDVWEKNKGALPQLARQQRELVIRIRQAISEYDVGNCEEALRQTQQLYIEHPDNQSVVMFLVTLLGESCRYEELKPVLDEAVRKYPRDGYILKYLGDYYRYVGEAEKARQTYITALDNTDNGMTELQLKELSEQDAFYSELADHIRG